VYNYIDSDVDGRIENAQELLGQPSISIENCGIRECAQLQERYFCDL